MIQIAPADPILRKIMLPSIIRISDARTGMAALPRTRERPRPGTAKSTVTSHALRAVIGQLRLEL